MSGSRQKLRAVLLSFVMVTSVMAAGVAFTGTAAADANNLSVTVPDKDGDSVAASGHGLVAGTGEVTVDADVATSSGNDLVIAYDHNDNNTIARGDVVAVIEDDGPNDLKGSTLNDVEAKINLTDAENINVGDVVGESSTDGNFVVLEDTNGNGQLDADQIQDSDVSDFPVDLTNIPDDQSDSITLNSVMNIPDGGGDIGTADGAGALGSIDTTTNGDRILISPVNAESDNNYDGGFAVSGDIILEPATGTPTIDTGNPVIDVDNADPTIKGLSLAVPQDNDGITSTGSSSSLTVENTEILLDATGSFPGGASSFGIKATVGGDSITAKNLNIDTVDANDITDSSADEAEFGIRAFGASTVDVQQSTFEDLGYSVFVEGGSGHTIDDNNFTRNYGTTVVLGADSNDMDTSSVTVNSNTFGAVGQGVHLFEDGKALTGGAPTISENDFSQVGSGSYTPNGASSTDAIGASTGGSPFNGDGLVLSGDVTFAIDGSNNYYGDSSGPSGQGPGTGTKVDQEVAFRPYYTDNVGGTLSGVSGSIASTEGQAQNSQIVVTFTEPVYDADETSSGDDLATTDLDTSDFNFNDASNGGVSISGVSHSAGDKKATVTLTGAATSADQLNVTTADGDNTEGDDNDGVFNGGGQSISTQKVAAVGNVGPSDGDIRVNIGGAANQSLLAGSASQSLNLIRITDTSGTASLADSTILKMPDGVTINESQTSLSISTTGSLETTGSITDQNTITIDHGQTKSSQDETMRVGGIVVDTAADVTASQSGSANDITVDYALNEFDAGILDVYKPGAQLGSSNTISAGSSGQSLGTDLTISTSTVDNQITNQTDIVVNANQSNGITFDDSLDLSANADALITGTDSKVDDTDSGLTLTSTSLTIPVTANFSAGDSISVDGGTLALNASGTASSGSLFQVETQPPQATGSVSAEQTATGNTIDINKPEVRFGSDGTVTQAIGDSEIEMPEGTVNSEESNSISIEDTAGSQMAAGENVTITLNNSGVTFDTSQGVQTGNNFGDEDKVSFAVDDGGDGVSGGDTGSGVDVAAAEVNQDSLEIELSDQGSSATSSGDHVVVQDLHLNVSSSVANATDVGFTVETTAGSNNPTVISRSNETNSAYKLTNFEPTTQFNKAGGGNVTFAIDGDGESGFQVGADADQDGALKITHKAGTHAAAGTNVNITLDGDTGVTFDKSNSGNVDVTGVGGGTVDVSSTTVTDDTIAIALDGDASDGLDEAGDAIEVDELYLNGTSGAQNTTLTVTTNTSFNLVDTNVERRIITEADEPSAIFGDSSITDTENVFGSGQDDNGPSTTLNRDGNNGADFGTTDSEEASSQIQTGATAFGSIYVTNSGDFGNADVDLTIAQAPDGASGQGLNTSTVTTGSNGVADFEFTAGDETGTYIVNATTSNNNGVNITYDVTAGSASQLNVTNVDNALVDNGPSIQEDEVAALRVRIEDDGGNIVTNRNVDVAVSISGGSLYTSGGTTSTGLAEEIANDGTAKQDDNPVKDRDDDGRFNYKPVTGGTDNDGDSNLGDFYIFVKSTSAQDIDVTVTDESQGTGVNAITEDSATTTIYEDPNSVDISFNTTSAQVGDGVRADAVAQTSNGEDIQVPRLSADGFELGNNSVATLGDEESQTGDDGIVSVNLSADAQGTTTINQSIKSTEGEATITVEEDAPAYYTLKLSNSIADRDVHAAIISIFSTHRQSGSTALLPHSVYRYTRTHTGGQR